MTCFSNLPRLPLLDHCSIVMSFSKVMHTDLFGWVLTTSYELHRHTIDTSIINDVWWTSENTMWLLKCDLLCQMCEEPEPNCWLLPLRAFFCSFMVSDDFFLISWRDLLYSWNKINRDALVTGMYRPLCELILSCIYNIDLNKNIFWSYASKGSLTEADIWWLESD